MKNLILRRLQDRLIKGQRTFDIADSQDHVVEHCSLLQITRASTAFSPCMDRLHRQRRLAWIHGPLGKFVCAHVENFVGWRPATSFASAIPSGEFEPR